MPDYCKGYCPKGTQLLTTRDEKRRGMCDECADEMDARDWDGFGRRLSQAGFYD